MNSVKGNLIFQQTISIWLSLSQKNEERFLATSIVTGPINVLLLQLQNRVILFSTECFTKTVLLYLKKQMSKETFDMINEQSQRKS